MADNAIEKLFDEMREAKRKIAECNAEEARLSDARNANLKALRAAMDRAELLDVTLDKHIHEGMPVVQAKMQAHEDATQTNSKVGRISATSITAGSISVNAIMTSKMVVKRERIPRPTAPSIW